MKISINQTKLKSTVGFILAFLVAYGPDIVTWIGGMQDSPKWLRELAKGLGVFIGVLTSKHGVAILNWFTTSNVVPLLEGSSVVQVKPPTVGVSPSLLKVAVDVADVPMKPTNSAAVIPQAPMAVPSKRDNSEDITRDIPPPRKPDAGHLTWGMFFFVVVLSAMACFACILVGERMARAQTVAPQAIGCFDKANTYCLVPATALGDQVNLKDGSVTNGVLLVGLVLQHEFGTIPLGLGLYGGLGASTKNQGSYQGCIGVSITSWGLLCGGVQRATFADGSTALQGMLTFAGQLTSGGTPSFVRAQFQKLTAISTSAGTVTGYPVDLNSGKAAR